MPKRRKGRAAPARHPDTGGRVRGTGGRRWNANRNRVGGLAAKNRRRKR